MTSSSIPPVDLPDASKPRALIYARDKESESIIRQCLVGLGVTDALFRPGGVKTATSEISNVGALQLLIVDADGQDPMASIPELMSACSPSTGVIVLGEADDLSLYRHLREAGVADYIFKPLVSSLVTKACSRILNGAHEREGPPLGPAGHGDGRPRRGRRNHHRGPDRVGAGARASAGRDAGSSAPLRRCGAAARRGAQRRTAGARCAASSGWTHCSSSVGSSTSPTGWT